MGNIFCCGRPEDEANQRQGEDYKHGEEGHIDRHGQLVTEDGSRLFPEAAKHREKADKAAKSMIEHAQEAKKAYEAGDFAKAGEQKKLKEQMREAMLESNRKAVASIIDPQNWKDTGKLDLHGLYVAEATEVSREMLNHFYDQGNVKKASVEIVTGAGHHSINNKALIKPAILKLLEGKVAYEMEHDGGCIVVNMNGMLVDESHAIIF